MDITFSKKAETYIEKNGIKSLYIENDLHRKGACCELATINILISERAEGVGPYKKYQKDDLTIYLDSLVEDFLEEDEEIKIDLFSLPRKKYLYTNKEVSPLRD